ncbi:MAG: FAD-dependent oxidoreductase, partial [Anaerolineales bacterium]|nr:FAD-dependent oxidoreductase [Anaerolineales bacterium]
AGIHFCATCDGPFYKGKPVAVIGGGTSAAEESLFLVKFVERVTLLVRGESLSASQVIQEKVLGHPQIEVRFKTEVVRFAGSGGKLGAVTVRDNASGTEAVIHPAGVFVFVGLTPNTGYLQGSGVVLDRWGFVVTGHDLAHVSPETAGRHEGAALETSVPGIFAAGDLRAGSTKQVASAAGEGAAAALLIREHLRRV